MRHRKDTLKLGRTAAHRDELLGSLVSHLVLARRIQTTVVKAKAARRLAERMVTLAKRNTLASRRAAVARLHNQDAVAALFEQLGPAFKDRQGGYTRIVRLGQRLGDGAETALLEWVNFVPQPKAKKKDKKEKPGEKPEAKAPEKKADKKTEKKAAEKSKAKA
ncbi:MAG TPA: 50S ribosomal protein L17 [Kiritimatiellia bacterium]|nr:50S ribosomal protein L17 [Kiritimatiellia bacterium]HRZ13689.1 50S ribosomal protein L17 [Kiritimatiellia bacterium]HSA19215.1 50S ribosomal protein L17 [Kiritimatiellia bacterium]